MAASKDPAGGVCGNGGTPCKVESLFILLASVGLTVLAPNPDAWLAAGSPVIVDILLPAEVGVCVLRPFGRAGDFEEAT